MLLKKGFKLRLFLSLIFIYDKITRQNKTDVFIGGKAIVKNAVTFHSFKIIVVSWKIRSAFV